MFGLSLVVGVNNVALQPIAAIAAFIALKMRDGDGAKTVMVEANGRQLTSGRIENGRHLASLVR